VVDSRWQPKQFRRYIETIKSSSLTAVIETDAGRAYLKAINNPQGVHVLACDWIGTRLARRFGLRTFDIAILEIAEDDEIRVNDRLNAAPGPAFITRAEEGEPMGGEASLKRIDNLDDVVRLIVFDTWVRNCDRYAPGMGRGDQPRMRPDNLFLSADGAPEDKLFLKAIDHGHIFTCGRQLTPSIANIEMIKEEKLYGCFPFFHGVVSVEQICWCAKELKEKCPSLCSKLMTDLPDAWDVSSETRQAIDRFLLERAAFLADNIKVIAQEELGCNDPSQKTTTPKEENL
jgi:HipA-like protein